MQITVQALVNYPPKIAISKLVNSLKGVSSRRLRQVHPEITHHYWKSQLWSPSYFAGSCGGAPIEIVRQYIEQHGDSRFAPFGPDSPDHSKTIVNRAGFRKPTKDGGFEYFVLQQVWRTEVCKGLDSTTVCRFLAERGAVIVVHSVPPAFGSSSGLLTRRESRPGTRRLPARSERGAMDE